MVQTSKEKRDRTEEEMEGATGAQQRLGIQYRTIRRVGKETRHERWKQAEHIARKPSRMGDVRKVMHGSDGEGSSEIGKGCGSLRRDMCDARRGDKSMYACQRSGLGE